jgi:hypothetical protein
MLRGVALIAMLVSMSTSAYAQTSVPKASGQPGRSSLLAPLTFSEEASAIWSGGGQGQQAGGPNGWVVVGGLTVASAILVAVSYPSVFSPLGFTRDSVSWVELAAYGAVIGAGIGLTFCLVKGCDWGAPRLPKRREPPPPRASLLVGRATIGVRITW